MDKKQENNVQLNVNVDTTPVLYTDNIIMGINEDGVVLNIGQLLLGTNQMRIVSRIGMSREHAKKFVKELTKLLAITEGQAQTGEKNQN